MVNLTLYSIQAVQALLLFLYFDDYDTNDISFSGPNPNLIVFHLEVYALACTN